jgi:integrase
MSAARIPVDAGVVIYRHGRTWWIDIHQEAGRRVRRNLRTASRESALKIARELASGVVSRLWNVAAAQKLTIASALALYRESVAWANFAPETRGNTLRILGVFSRWLARRRVDLLDRIGRADVEAFARWRLEPKGETDLLVPPAPPPAPGRPAQPPRGFKLCPSPTTVNAWLSRISAFLSWAQTQGFVRFNAAARVRLKTRPPEPKAALAPAKIEALAATCNPTLRDLVIVLSNTALRITEALQLRGKDIDAGSRTLLVYAPKTNRREPVGINEEALPILLRRALAAGKQGLLFTTSTGEPLSRRNVRRDLMAAGKRARLVVTGPHMLRRSACTEAARVMSPSELREFARHRDVRTTQAYYVGTLRPMPPVVARLSPGGQDGQQPSAKQAT